MKEESAFHRDEASPEGTMGELYKSYTIWHDEPQESLKFSERRDQSVLPWAVVVSPSKQS